MNFGRKKEKAEEHGWHTLTDLLCAISKSLATANDMMENHQQEQDTYFTIKDAKIEISHELNQNAGEDQTKIRLPIMGRKVNADLRESDLCKITYTIGHLPKRLRHLPEENPDETILETKPSP
ncbi:MAG: hypothetical protein OXT67_01365 [Zetaproteobacteria bacterium]|nr:hypothetical protein [Zetaproteobacteria bacterium]